MCGVEGEEGRRVDKERLRQIEDGVCVVYVDIYIL